MKQTGSPTAEIDSSRLEVMNFLNEMAGRFPQAVSFASGRPAESFFDVQRWIAEVPRFVSYQADQSGASEASTLNVLAQYGRTSGIINALIAQQAARDEGIACDASQVLVTAGCQEAISLCVTTLCREAGDVVLVRSPTYIGITGVCDLNGIELAPFSCDTADDLGVALDAALSDLARRGKRARALYLVPDFDNPTGTVMTRKDRESIIALCAQHGVVILEDNPYGMFRFDGEAIPTMYALDTHACVVYLGTYSKTVCPALRIGYAVVPHALLGVAGAGVAFMGQLAQAKSFSTVNTSQMTQAMLGGILLAEDFSLKRMVAPSIAFYRANRDAMLASLASAFAGHEERISWNTPQGGFFLIVRLPFDFKFEEAQMCASDYGVLVMPLSFFALNGEHDTCVRLAFSNGTPQSIRTGVERFSRFVKDHLALQAG